jgi:hypothetical protein
MGYDETAAGGLRTCVVRPDVVLLRGGFWTVCHLHPVEGEQFRDAAAGVIKEPELVHATQALPCGVFYFGQLHPVRWTSQGERGGVRQVIALGQGGETRMRVGCDTHGRVMPRILHPY